MCPMPHSENSSGTVSVAERASVSRMRSRHCETCGGAFSYAIGRGNDRRHCSNACRKSKQLRLRAERKASAPPCVTADCVGIATRKSGLCEACYARLRRNGNVEKRKPTYRYSKGGYVVLLRPDHPLADKEGRVMEHRAVMYEALRGKPLSCFWCTSKLTWGTAVIDHLDENKGHNAIGNLVASCNDCNRSRGAILPFIRRLTDESFAKMVECFMRYRTKQ